jgi:hypothetical protein
MKTWKITTIIFLACPCLAQVQQPAEWRQRTKADEMTGKTLVIFTLFGGNDEREPAILDVFCTPNGKFDTAIFQPGMVLGPPERFEHSVVYGTVGYITVTTRTDEKIETNNWELPKDPRLLFFGKYFAERILSSKITMFELRSVDGKLHRVKFQPEVGSETVRQSCGLKAKKK